jgi:hypothetical protein
VKIVLAKVTGTLQYCFNDDESECIVIERLGTPKR